MRKSVAAAVALAIAFPAPAWASRYLFVWAMETRDPSTPMPPAASMGRDFLAVFDARPGRGRFGKLVAMLPVGSGARMAHHTNYDMPKDGLLFASDYMSAKAFVLDVRKPAEPRLRASFGDAGAFTHPHSFERLPNGNTLATYQFKGASDDEPGALVELDPAGKVVRASDAADASDPFVRPYSVLALPKIDRVVTTSASMMASDKSTRVVQLWRLSDLKLLKTIPLERPAHFADAVAKSAAEARLLEDGSTVLVVTAGCGLYRLDGLSGDNPEARFVYDFGFRACGVPTVVGRYWIQTTTSGRQLVSLDVSDPLHPKEAGRLPLGPNDLPHWVSREPDGNRIVITGFGSLSTHALFARLNPGSGALTLAPEQIDFDRRWPDQWNGPAMPHAALFGD